MFETVYMRFSMAVKRQFIPDIWSTNRKHIAMPAPHHSIFTGQSSLIVILIKFTQLILIVTDYLKILISHCDRSVR